VHVRIERCRPLARRLEDAVEELVGDDSRRVQGREGAPDSQDIGASLRRGEHVEGALRAETLEELPGEPRICKIRPDRA
jgi:hypothetical protein